MQFSSETPMVEITVQGEKFSVPQPYKGGRPMSKNDATALNATLVYNIRQNWASRCKLAKKKGDPLPDQAALDEYLSTYELGVKPAARGPRAAVDPVDAEAKRIAWDSVKAALKRANYDIKTVTPELKAEMLTKALEQNPAFREEAARRVASQVSVDLAALTG